jgi:hypothetical protein
MQRNRWWLIAHVASLVLLLGGSARADDYPSVDVIPDRLYLTRGFSVRNGDWFSIEPSFLLVSRGVDPKRPIVPVGRPILGVGGSGVGLGVATTLARPCSGPERCAVNDFLLSGPIVFEARAERMYGPTRWHSATYVGPHVTLSAYLLKISAGGMVNLTDRADVHFQAAIGGGF